jgi:hypothetical protein
MKYQTAMLVALLVGGGCMQPVEPTDTTKKNPPPLVIINDPVVEPPENNLSLSISAEPSFVATLHELIGDSGSLTINPARPIVVSRPEVSLTIPPGVSISYELTGEGGSLVFSDPKPTVSAKVWGLRVSPKLARLDLSSDNTGTAHVQSGPVKLTRRFSLGWSDGDATGSQPATDNRPVVRMFVADWCGVCKTASAALASADVPFRIEPVPEPHPFRVTLPYFEWRDQSGNRWGVQGWTGLADLIARWKATHSEQASATGPEWTFPGSTREDLINHLQTHPNHSAEFAGRSLSDLSFTELKRQHSDSHNAPRPTSR